MKKSKVMVGIGEESIEKLIMIVNDMVNYIPNVVKEDKKLLMKLAEY